MKSHTRLIPDAAPGPIFLTHYFVKMGLNSHKSVLFNVIEQIMNFRHHFQAERILAHDIDQGASGKLGDYIIRDLDFDKTPNIGQGKHDSFTSFLL